MAQINNTQTKTQTVIANKPTRNKIGFFSAIILVIGSTIGAGIFFKSQTVLDNSGSNLFFAIFSWLVAGIAVVALALALIEVASARNDNLSILGWNKTFNSRLIFKSSKWFMTYVYIPFTFYFMPLYVIMSLQDALTGFGLQNNFGTSNDWLIWMGISIAIIVYFVVSTGLSARYANLQNWTITAIKFFPLIIVILLGFILAGKPITVDGTELGGIQNVDQFITWNSSSTDFFQLSPFFGILGSIGAIFFAFDGFYTTAGLSTEMKQPRKTPLAIVFGILAITIIYIVISTSMSLGAGGKFSDFSSWLSANNASWVFGVVNLLIAIGVLGIINGYSGWSSRFLIDLIDEGEIKLPKTFVLFYKRKKELFAVLYVLVISIVTIIVMNIIGSLGYFASSSYLDDAGASVYDSVGFRTSQNYTFADLMATWVSVFAFAFIAFAIFGAFVNRYKKRVKVVQNKHFKWAAVISILVVSLSMGATVLQPFIDIILLGINGLLIVDNAITQVFIGKLVLIGLLIFFVIICVVPTYIEKANNERIIKKYGTRIEVYLRGNRKYSDSEKIDLSKIKFILDKAVAAESFYKYRYTMDN